MLTHGHQRVSSPARRQVFGGGGGVDEPAAEPGSVLDVVRAAAPVPALRQGAAALQPGVTAALRHVALTTGARHGVDQPRSHHRVNKRRFFGSYWTRGREGQSDIINLTFYSKNILVLVDGQRVCFIHIMCLYLFVTCIIIMIRSRSHRWLTHVRTLEGAG